MMDRVFNNRTMRFSLFKQFYAIFFLLIMVPAIIASLLVYTHVVKVMEREVDKSSEVVIGQFAGETNKLIHSMQNEMIKLLDYSGLDSFIRSGDGMEQYRRNEIMTGLYDRLQTLIEHPLASSAYMYLPDKQLIIDSSSGHFSPEMFFQYTNFMPELASSERDELFSGRKMMAMTRSMQIQKKPLLSKHTTMSGQYVSAMISYPYNTDSPKVYLVVNINQEQLSQNIKIIDQHYIETAIMNEQGDLLAHAGQHAIDSPALLEAYRKSDAGTASMTVQGRRYRVAFEPSNSYKWIYVSLTDLKELRKPAETIRLGSLIFLSFFLIVGTVISYYLSRRMYMPIKDIKRQLERTRRTSAHLPPQSGNEFDLIKHWSKLLITENKDMSTLISGVSPVVQEHFLGKVLYGELNDDLSVQYYAKEIGLDVDVSGAFSAICIDLQYREYGSRKLTETDKSFLIVELKDGIVKAMETDVRFCLVSKDLLVCIVHLNPGAAESQILVAGEAIRNVCEENTAYYYSAIGLGCAVDGLWHLHESYRLALRLLKGKKLYSGAEICTDLDDWGERSTIESFLSTQKVNQMLQMYESGQREEMLQLVHGMLDSDRLDGAPAERVKQLCIDSLNTWLRAAATDSRHDFSIEKYSSLFQRLHECATIEELKRFFESAHAELFTDQEILPERFEAVLSYIKGNFHSDISIEQFARELNMSIGHFSRSFKEAVGEKYVEYLLRCRMKAAKRLLADTELKLDDIALQVGYLSRNSFIKAFRKHEGVTPGKYRESLSG
ncbi:helix-turn-helix domain-containing protein [Paenibacillus sp. J5C_2022]|uniref:helix-turn-helix domain-containing protein n=1 Tax=Paenibacillus sp. J5C2022 TaxID=2977129 RepID=UPI0021D3602B|nr:helix-turn-helix domain-containing protein [Paenibacillus sp. J5C2022]MCU6708906.1 helix-turn-helix domain-containing protein [Paenibacillus sp. J5C2022]